MASTLEANSEVMNSETETGECCKETTSQGATSMDEKSEALEAEEGASNSKDGRNDGEGGGGGDSEDSPKEREMVDFKVVYNKQKYDVSFALDDTVENLKSHFNTLTGVPVSMQKVMFKGRMKDEATLREHKVTKGSKIMLVGSTVNDVMSVAAPDPKTLKEEEKKAAASSKEPLSTQKPHKTILEKYGKPEDAMPGRKNSKEPLPPHPVSGMYNKSGGKVRLTFKLELDQLWIGTKERTEKLPMGSIKAVVSEPLHGQEDYHMMGIQLGPTEASRYWIYWVPAQYVDAIKDAILGKWQFF